MNCFSQSAGKPKGPFPYGKLIQKDSNALYKAINNAYTWCMWGWNGTKRFLWGFSCLGIFFLMPLVVESLFEQNKIMQKILMSQVHGEAPDMYEDQGQAQMRPF